MPKCQGTNKNGTACTRFARPGSRYCWQHGNNFRNIKFVTIMGILIASIGLISDFMGITEKVSQRFAPIITSTAVPYFTNTPSPTFTITPTRTPFYTPTPRPDFTPQAIGWVLIRVFNGSKNAEGIEHVQLLNSNFFRSMSSTSWNFPFDEIPQGDGYTLRVIRKGFSDYNWQGISISPGTAEIPYEIVVNLAYPPPGDLVINKCVEFSWGKEPVKEQVCVDKIVFDKYHQMKFYISWEMIDIPYGVYATKGSDVGNPNMYITDEHGNRYDVIDLGGSARELTKMYRGDIITGWYLFPPPDYDSEIFIFHDDDMHFEITELDIFP